MSFSAIFPLLPRRGEMLNAKWQQVGRRANSSEMKKATLSHRPITTSSVLETSNDLFNREMKNQKKVHSRKFA